MISLSTCFSYHRLLFIILVFFILTFSSTLIPQQIEFQLALIFFLFFGLGMPHGALDMAVGQKIFSYYFPNHWKLLFLVFYLSCTSCIILLWLWFPTLSFLGFLAISVIHFGLSDTDKPAHLSTFFIIERVTRGLLPLSLPAYINDKLFLKFIEIVLSPDQALLVLYLTQVLFWSTLICAVILISYYWMQAFLTSNVHFLMNGGELFIMIPLFILLPPFTSFLVYFCFLHSVRHILTVLQTQFETLNSQSFFWLIKNSIPATMVASLSLVIAFWYFQKETVTHQDLMIRCFFLSLASLTFPHMILIEWNKRLALLPLKN
jgi:beta-carotene 15,15'-dioxygenase